MLNSLHADRFFLAVDGLDLEAGPSTPDVLEAQLNSSMARVAREIIVVADSSKLGRQSVTRIGPIKIDRLITDRRAPGDFVETLRKRGVQVSLV
jgi:DeoR/GlpR family transcriptional regulator of sugar metabolism